MRMRAGQCPAGAVSNFLRTFKEHLNCFYVAYFVVVVVGLSHTHVFFMHLVCFRMSWNVTVME